MKHFMIFLGLLICLMTDLYAFEMWNGISTEMNMNEIIINLKNIFQDTSTNKIGNGWGKDKPEIFSDNNNAYKDSANYPNDLVTYWFLTELPAYHAGSSPIVYFWNSKFFAIRIPFAADDGIVFQAAKEKYGNNYKIVNENYAIGGNDVRTLKTYIWETVEKIVYLHCDPKNGTWHPGILTVINKQLLNEYKQEQLKLQEQRRQEQEARRNAANSGVKL
jgi:hypothetical protein